MYQNLARIHIKKMYISEDINTLLKSIPSLNYVQLTRDDTGNIGQRIITIQRNWQHRVENNDNPEKLATQGTQDEDKQNKNNPEKLATQGTQDEDKQNKNAICVGHHYAQIPLHEGKTNTRLLFGS